jgi:predicted dehydrogenase
LTVRAAIVGLGSWGQTLVDSVQGKLDTLRFTSACTRTPAKAQDFCVRHRIALVPSYEDLLADNTIDAVVLTTPHSQHEAQIRAAAAAGKHVFSEKPLALDRHGVKAAIAAAESAGIVLAVGFNRRFHPCMRELVSRVKREELGAIGSVIAELTATTGLYRSPDSWRVDPKEEPAGAMAGIGVHLIDGMIDAIGRIAEAYCVVSQRAVGYGPDTTSLLLTFENGATGLAYCSAAAARNFRFAVYGSKGFAEVLGATMDRFRFVPAVQGRASHLARAPEGEMMETAHVNTTTEELRQFAQSIIDGTPFPVPLADVIHGACVFDAAVESARTRQPVRVAGGNS